MKLVKIYECLCDATRLRLLNLLLQGPLCVCHIQAVLGEPQVKISKHLGYLKARGLVTVRRQGNWMIYALPVHRERSPELEANLACLQDCVNEDGTCRLLLILCIQVNPPFSFSARAIRAAATSPRDCFALLPEIYLPLPARAQNPPATFIPWLSR